MRKHIKTTKEFINRTFGKDNHTLDEDNLEDCIADITNGLRNMFKGRKLSISPSQTSQGARYMWHVLNESPQDTTIEKFKPETQFKMIMGTVAEPILLLIMKEAGVDIQNQQGRVKHDINGLTVKGSKDFEVDGKTWDLKTTNHRSYVDSFKSAQTLAHSDGFKAGYITQLDLYSEEGAEQGGWLVVDTDSFNFKSVPYKNITSESEFLMNSFKNRLTIAQEADTFEDIPPCYKPKEDGSLQWQCNRCPFKKECWGDV